MKRGFLRLDDFPYSGEMYARYECFRDAWSYGRFMRAIEACQKYGAVPEVMVSSHAVRKNGTFVRFDDVLPRTVAAMRLCYTQGLININAHGMTHLNCATYVNTGRVDPKEFLNLDEAETRKHLVQNINFIYDVFDKKPKGFVAPAWGYQAGVTKKVASEFFLYIADSYDHWREGACMDFGAVDTKHGFVHFPETWRYGRYSNGRSIFRYWDAEMRKSDLIHMMQHGYRIPGKWKLGLSINPMKTMNHLLYGNLLGVLKAASEAGVVWGTLEAEAECIRGDDS